MREPPVPTEARREDAAATAVAVLGAHGRMGSLTCAAVEDADDLRLIARIGRADPIGAAAAADVLVDFTSGDRTLDHVRWAAGAGKHVVVGASGLSEHTISAMSEACATAPRPVGVVVVPNFSVGAFLARHFAVSAMRHFDSVEVIEAAHHRKLDAPSATAHELAQALGDHAPDPGAQDLGIASRGMRVGPVTIHSVRLHGMVNHQQVMLGRTGEVLSIRFDTLDRAAYMPGVLQAIRTVRTMTGLHLGLESVYGDLLPGPATA